MFCLLTTSCNDKMHSSGNTMCFKKFGSSCYFCLYSSAMGTLLSLSVSDNFWAGRRRYGKMFHFCRRKYQTAVWWTPKMAPTSFCDRLGSDYNFFFDLVLFYNTDCWSTIPTCISVASMLHVSLIPNIDCMPRSSSPLISRE